MCKAEDNNAVTACLFDTFYHQKTICNRMGNHAKCTSSVVNASVSIHLDKFVVCGRRKTKNKRTTLNLILIFQNPGAF